MSGFYVLEGGAPSKVETLERWRSWFFGADREVARTMLTDGTCITTEFVGVDGQEGGEGRAPPLLFETRTFASGRSPDTTRRYASWTQARLGHRDTVRRHIRRLV